MSVMLRQAGPHTECTAGARWGVKQASAVRGVREVAEQGGLLRRWATRRTPHDLRTSGPVAVLLLGPMLMIARILTRREQGQVVAVTYMSGDEFERTILQPAIKTELACWKCGSTFTFEDGGTTAINKGIHGKVMCPNCQSIYEVDVTPHGVTLVADVTANYPQAREE